MSTDRHQPAAATCSCGHPLGDHQTPGAECVHSSEPGMACGCVTYRPAAATRSEFARAVAEQVLDDGYPFPREHRWWADKAEELARYVLDAEAHAEKYRLALQDVQGIALNGLEVGDTEADRLFAIDQRVGEVLPDAE